MKILNKKKSIALSVLGLVAIVSVSAGAATYASANTETTVPYAISDTTLQIEHGGALRIGEVDGNNGIGYKVYVDGGEYTKILENTGAGKTYKSVSYGILIAPYSYHKANPLNETNVFGNGGVYDYAVWENGGWSYTQSSKKRIINLSTNTLSLDAKTNEYYYSGFMVNVQEGNLAREFYGVGYISYTLNSDDSVHYYFADYENNHISPAYIAQRELESASSSLDETEKTWLQENYLDKVADSAKTTTYKVEKYVGDKLKDTQTVTGATVGSTVTATPVENDPTITYNASKSTASGTVYYNGKTTLKMYYDRVTHTETNEYLVDVQNVNDFADLGAEGAGAEYLANYTEDELSFEFTNNVTEKTYTIDSVAQLNTIPYTTYSLEIKADGITVYSAPIDLYDSTQPMVWNDCTDAKYLVAETNDSLLVDTTGESFMGAGNYYYYYKSQGNFGDWKAAKVIAQHSKAYYQLYSTETLTFDIGFLATDKIDNLEGVTETGYIQVIEPHGQTGTQTKVYSKTPITVTVGVQTLIDNFDEFNEKETAWNATKYFLMNHSQTITSAGGYMYIGNFGALKPVVAYTEKTEYLVDKQDVTSFANLGSTASQSHLAGYANRQAEMSYTFENVVDTTLKYTINSLSDLSTVPGARYTLTIKIGSETLYTSPIDLYDSTEDIVWNTIESKKYVSFNDHYAGATATLAAETKGEDFFMGAGNYYSYHRDTSLAAWNYWSKFRIFAQHSIEYYQLFDQATVFKYDVGFVSDDAEDTTSYVNISNINGDTVSIKTGVPQTFTCSLADIVENYSAMNGAAASVSGKSFFTHVNNSTAGNGTMYIGNIRFEKPVVVYTETAEYLVDKQDVTSFANLGSTASQSHLAGYANREDEMSFTFVDAVSAQEYTISDLANLSTVPGARYTLTIKVDGQTLYTAPIDLYDSTEGFVWSDALHTAYMTHSHSNVGINFAVDTTNKSFSYKQNQLGWWSSVRILAQHSAAYYEMYKDETMKYDVVLQYVEGVTDTQGIYFVGFSGSKEIIEPNGTKTYDVKVSDLITYITEGTGKFLQEQNSVSGTNFAVNITIGNFRLAN